MRQYSGIANLKISRVTSVHYKNLNSSFYNAHVQNMHKFQFYRAEQIRHLLRKLDYQEYVLWKNYHFFVVVLLFQSIQIAKQNMPQEEYDVGLGKMCVSVVVSGDHVDEVVQMAAFYGKVRIESRSCPEVLDVLPDWTSTKLSTSPVYREETWPLPGAVWSSFRHTSCFLGLMLTTQPWTKEQRKIAKRAVTKQQIKDRCEECKK